jgi:hypothetical protein
MLATNSADTSYGMLAKLETLYLSHGWVEAWLVAFWEILQRMVGWPGLINKAMLDDKKKVKIKQSEKLMGLPWSLEFY